ncbi:MAG: 4Fe-4S binding protein [Chloroflexota bacterium]
MAQKTTLYQPRHALDVLKLPLIGRLLRMRYGRLVLQIPFLLIAGLLIYDGFTGPDRAAQNMATVVPWVHYRGVVVLAILLAGNLFCMGCPFTIPRTLAKRLSIRGRRFPRVLRNKWTAIIMLFLLFFAYEYLDMWASPALTAWVIVAYFVASFVFEAFFSESAFCKYVCPLGTFNFVYSTASPTQITAKNRDICQSCQGKECINGSYSSTPTIRIDEIPVNGVTEPREVRRGPSGTLGCGTELFAPQIKSNLDCVFCLDCVRACPHDNIGLMTRMPGRELIQPDAWPKRWDISFLIIGLAFMGIVNAFGMIPPVYDLLDDLAVTLGLRSLGLTDSGIEFVTLGIVFVLGSFVIPVIMITTAAALTRWLSKTQRKYNLRQTVATFAPAFVPIGFGIWIAHYAFHFLIGALSIIPIFHFFLLDHGVTVFGDTPNWALGGMDHQNPVMGLIQVIALVGGFLLSMLIAQRAAVHVYRRDAVPALLPWALILLSLALVAAWVFSQPMEMRGTILFS